ncbi:GHKL domain-containing protein [Carnobacteriaceae bacterium 52-44]
MENNWVWIAIVLGILALFLVIYVIYQRKEIAFYKLQQTELDQYATEVETVYRQLRGIKHDYRNHLQGMSAFIETNQLDELQDYIHQLNNELNQVDTIIRTGNTMVDALVNTKLTIAQESGVELHATAIAPEKLSIENVDLAIILGNLLNNAIEATTKVDENKNEQFIRLYIAPMKDNFYISVTNTMKRNPQPRFLSLKGPNRQGYGISRIDQAVEKYEGLVNRQWEDGVFATEITIPLNEA